MRVRALALVAAALATGCGSNGGGEPSPGASGQTLGDILRRDGTDVALTPGTSDYAPGPVRLSFLVVTLGGAPIFRPTARVWVASSLKARPFAEATARLEDVGVPGVSEAAVGDVTRLYVAHFSIPRPGRFWVAVEPVGSQVQAVGQLVVRKRTAAPGVGEQAILSRTPTIRSTRGNLAALTTQTPPDTSLLRYSVAESLAARKPFVVSFATPKFCTSRTCGPVVDVVERVSRRFAATGVRFIHVEIFEGNDPGNGVNRWVKEWRLPTEPFTFLVGRDGRIRARFEGSVSIAELSRAVRRYLTGSPTS